MAELFTMLCQTDILVLSDFGINKTVLVHLLNLPYDVPSIKLETIFKKIVDNS